MNNNISANIQYAFKSEIIKAIILGGWFLFGAVMFVIDLVLNGGTEPLIIYFSFGGCWLLYQHFEIAQQFYSASENNNKAKSEAMKIMALVNNIVLLTVAILQFIAIINVAGKF